LISAGKESLKPFFEPRVVAIIGASDKPGKVGNTILINFLRGNFKGEVYPVNPKYNSLFEKKCYASVKEVPEPIDLAVIAVPASIVFKVMEDCAEKHVRAAIIISGGFKETGPNGARLEKEVAAIAKRGNVRVIGPNCIGVYNPETNVDTMFLPEEKLRRPPKGSIALLSQSGAFMGTILDWAAYEGLGISKAVSYGNECDVDLIDLIEFLADDPSTKVIAVYVEGIERGQKFIRVVKEATTKKPVIAVKAGRSTRGKAAVLSHTGSLAGEDVLYSMTFKQTGVVRVDDFEEMLDLAKAFALQPPAKGDRVLIITDGGGAGVMAVDACEHYGLNVPELDPKLQEELKKYFPPYCSTHNPIDLTGDTDNQRYRIALEKAFLNYRGVDSAVVILLVQAPALTVDVVDIIRDINNKSARPMVACCMGGEYSAKVAREVERRGIPSYPTPERAVRAIWALTKYGQWKLRDAWQQLVS
jgi:acetyl coenzyme A synthetase (ADP forming)-like protein